MLASISCNYSNLRHFTSKAYLRTSIIRTIFFIYTDAILCVLAIALVRKIVDRIAKLPHHHIKRDIRRAHPPQLPPQLTAELFNFCPPPPLSL